MDAITYLSKLTNTELEVEYQVRGLLSRATDASTILVNQINSEISDKSFKPVKSHVKENPDVESQICSVRFEEISKLTQEQGVSPPYEFIVIGFAKTMHYKDRIERLINSFGDNPNLNHTFSTMRKMYNWYAKLWKEAENSQPQAYGPQIQTARTSSPTTKQANTTSQATQPPLSRKEVSFLLQNNENESLDTQSRVLITEGNRLRNSVADFFSKMENQRTANKREKSLPFSSNLSFDRLVEESNRPTNINQILPPQNSNIHRSTNTNQHLSQNQFRMSDFYKVRQKWHLSFDGSDTTNVHDFIYRLEQMAKDDGFPENHLPKILHLFLSKKAEDWYWVFKLDNPESSWCTMKTAMLSYFSSYDFEEEIREQILRKRQSKESFSDFALSVQKLNARLQNRLTTKELIYRLF